MLLNALNTICSASFLFDSILMKSRGHSRVLKSYDVKAIFKLGGLPHSPPTMEEDGGPWGWLGAMTEARGPWGRLGGHGGG